MPTQVGPYRIRETVAEGAVTSLFRAEDERLGRVVLLKTLKKSIADGSPFAAALDREAKILSRLAHASLPRLLDVAVESPPSWLALENIEGPTLSAVLERSPHVDVASSVAIALEMALGLGHMHTRHLVHRNLEPRGVVVCRDGRVVLLDFGLAEEVKSAAPSRFDVQEGVHGHRYMAPEQIMGEAATPMSDVFSVGVVLYEMLCGRGPWDEGKPGPTELSRRIRSEDPASLSVPGQRLPSALEQLVLRCLAKRPEDRFEDGTTLAQALENALDSMSTSPLPILISRALAIAGLGELLVEDKVPKRRKKTTKERPLQPLASQLAGLLVLIVLGAVVLEGFMHESTVSRLSEEQLNGKARGFLRVLAHPWAEVFVDGRLIDVTPMAKPIVVSLGRHYVTFKHPNAPDEQREIKVSGGQTVVVDVTMRIDRPAIDAGADAADDAQASP